MFAIGDLSPPVQDTAALIAPLDHRVAQRNELADQPILSFDPVLQTPATFSGSSMTPQELIVAVVERDEDRRSSGVGSGLCVEQSAEVPDGHGVEGAFGVEAGAGAGDRFDQVGELEAGQGVEGELRHQVIV